jgi:hypothetical protein
VTTETVSVGPLWGGDDLWHRAEADRRWRESYYFDFADEDGGVAGFTSIGWRPGRAVLGATTVVFAPHATLVARGERPTTSDFPTLEVGGLAYRRMGDALGHWHLAYDGLFEVVADPGTRAPTGPVATAVEPGRLEVEFAPTALPVTSSGPGFAPAFTWHLEQPGRTVGSVALDAGGLRLDGRGERDRSLGPRDWVHFDWWLYLAGHVDELTVNTWTLGRPDGSVVGTGWVQRVGSDPEPLARWSFGPESRLDVGRGGWVPEVLAFSFEGPGASVAGTVESTRLVPLDFSTRAGSGTLHRGVGRLAVGGREGWGQVEYQQRTTAPGPPETRWRAHLPA